MKGRDATQKRCRRAELQRDCSARRRLTGSLESAPLPCEAVRWIARVVEQAGHTCDSGGVAATPGRGQAARGWRGQRQADVAAAGVFHEGANTQRIAKDFNDAGGGGGDLLDKDEQ